MAEIIEPDAVICWISRIYLANNYGGDCIDLEPGACAMACTEEDRTDSDNGMVDIWGACGVVQISSDWIEVFKRENWDWQDPGNRCFWIACEDAVPVEDEDDARLRAYVALTGKTFVKEA
jgi:hypothetical protein